MTVKATRLGELGNFTFTGHQICDVVPFVALPSEAALYQWVELVNPNEVDPQTGRGRSCRAIVLEVGPWNDRDDAYVFAGARPLAEYDMRRPKRRTDGAGIQLSARVWRELGMSEDGDVTWAFVALIDQPPAGRPES